MSGGRAWLWAALVGADREYLLVRADDLDPPAGPTPEVRGEGVWAALECETPLEHWTVGLEAFGVEMEDPFDAWRGERGTRVGLGFDLEWEAAAPPVDEVGATAFRQACVVHGEILVGPSERIDLAAAGTRSRAWGRADLPSPRLPEVGHRDRDLEWRPVLLAPLQAGAEQVRYELCRLGDHAAAWRRA